jgi:hypothetical protein
MKQGRADKTTTDHKVAHPTTHDMSPRGVSQYGYATGSRLTSTGHYTTENSALPIKQGRGYEGPTPPAQGVGPGGGRTVHKSGTQGRH